ncbi:MAG TPA: NAD(P)-dependent oxidoreductase [Streptosporangiaceae bacterium]|nr:NAD(P)-dependent oxidoreductase [Streptosporangiaceae bacterium]
MDEAPTDKGPRNSSGNGGIPGKPRRPTARWLRPQAPLTKETHHLIDEAELRRMKPTLILVNTARGPIINDDALYLALKEGWIAGAGLDDIEEEPAKQRDWKPENPLFGLDNVVITPHAAYYSDEAIRTVRDFAAHEVARVLTGKPPLSPVNAAQLAMVQPRHSA